MTKSQIVTIQAQGTGLHLYPNKRYQMLIDSFGYVAFRDLETGDYLPNGLKEVP